MLQHCLGFVVVFTTENIISFLKKKKNPDQQEHKNMQNFVERIYCRESVMYTFSVNKRF